MGLIIREKIYIYGYTQDLMTKFFTQTDNETSHGLYRQVLVDALDKDSENNYIRASFIMTNSVFFIQRKITTFIGQ